MASISDSIVYNDTSYNLIKSDGRWHLYQGPMVMRNFGAFLIVKADVDEDGASHWPLQPVPGRNLCVVQCGNIYPVREKFRRLACGEITDMTYRNVRSKTKNPDPVDLSLYGKLTLSDIFKLIDSR